MDPGCLAENDLPIEQKLPSGTNASSLETPLNPENFVRIHNGDNINSKIPKFHSLWGLKPMCKAKIRKEENTFDSLAFVKFHRRPCTRFLLF